MLYSLVVHTEQTRVLYARSVHSRVRMARDAILFHPDSIEGGAGACTLRRRASLDFQEAVPKWHQPHWALSPFGTKTGEADGGQRARVRQRA